MKTRYFKFILISLIISCLLYACKKNDAAEAPAFDIGQLDQYCFMILVDGKLRVTYIDRVSNPTQYYHGVFIKK